MRMPKIGTFVWALVAFTTLVAAGPAAASCSLSSFNGIYGVLLSGSNTSGDLGAGLYQVDLDGSGGLTGTGTESGNGAIQTVTLTGTYTVSGNCTGTVTTKDQANSVSDFNIVLDNKSSEVELIRTDPGYTMSGQGFALGVAACGLTGKTASFAKRLDGHSIGTSKTPVSVVGRVTLDGKGDASATDTFSENGVIYTGKLKGSYIANANCTGSAQFTYKGTTYHFASIATNGGKKLLLLETDTGNVVFGDAVAQ